MSHLIQEYAKSCGVKIGKPELKPLFYPIKFEKYITINHATCPSTTYPYWEEVIDIIKPSLNRAGIKIIQLLDDQNQKIYSVDLHIQCSKKQSAFILKNSLTHIGVDSIYCYLAKEFSTPLISIYSHTNPNNTRPWSFKKSKSIEICAFDGKKPSYDPNENPKTIRAIKPEEIASGVLRMLKIKKEIKFKTLFIGSQYNNECIDVVPIANTNIVSNMINVRMDINYDESILKSILERNFAEVTLSYPISEEILNMKKITFINYIAAEFDAKFVEKVKSLGISMNLLCASEENLAKQRFKFFHYNVVFLDLKKVYNQNFDKIKNIPYKDIKTKSNKKIIIGNKEFKSYIEALNSKELFFLDLEHHYVYSN